MLGEALEILGVTLVSGFCKEVPVGFTDILGALYKLMGGSLSSGQLSCCFMC